MNPYQIEATCHEIDPNFWVPAVGNGQIATFVELVIRHSLIHEFKAHQDEADFASTIERICQNVSPGFWVPAVGNGQIANFVRFANAHNLWEKFQKEG